MTDYLYLDTNNLLRITPADMVGKMVGVMGSTGTGKSHSLAVLAEEMMPHMPMTFVDTAGEYWTLREKYDVLIAGRQRIGQDGTPRRNIDVEISVEDAATVAEYSFKNKVSVILDLLLFDKRERAKLLETYFHRLWELVTLDPQPYGIVCDEAQNYIPQLGTTAVKERFVQLVKEGRKFGISFLFASQRPASVTKDVMTQCPLFFLHAVYYPTDVATYSDIIPKVKLAEAEAMIDELQRGQAIFVNRTTAPPTYTLVMMRQRYTTHAGSTPELNGNHQAELRVIDEKTVEELKSLIVVPMGVDDSSGTARQREEAHKKQVAALNKEITVLKEQVEHWKSIAQGKNLIDAIPDDRVQLRMDEMPLPDELAARVEKRQGEVHGRVLKRQTGNLARLKSKILSLPKYEQEVFLLLARCPDKWLTIEDIARTLVLRANNISMRRVVETGLVSRNKQQKTHKFKFNDAVLGDMFPDLSKDYVIAEIMPIGVKS